MKTYRLQVAVDQKQGSTGETYYTGWTDDRNQKPVQAHHRREAEKLLGFVRGAKDARVIGPAGTPPPARAVRKVTR